MMISILLGFQSSRTLLNFFILTVVVFRWWILSRGIENSQRFSSDKDEIVSIESINDMSTSSVDIPSGGWFHKLTLADEKRIHTYPIKEDQMNQEKKCINSENPFMKPLKSIDSLSSASSMSHKLKRVVNSVKTLTDPPLIKESSWQKIALGLGKPFMRQIHQPSTISHVNSFRDILSQHHSLNNQSTRISITPSSWPSLVSSLESTKQPIHPVIHTPCTNQLDVNPLPDDLQMGLMNIHLEESPKTKFSRFYPLKHFNLDRDDSFHRWIYWISFSVCLIMVMAFGINRMEFPLGVFLSRMISVSISRMSLRLNSLFERIILSWNSWTLKIIKESTHV